MGEREDLLGELAERARFYQVLDGVGIPRTVSAAALAPVAPAPGPASPAPAVAPAPRPAATPVPLAAAPADTPVFSGSSEEQLAAIKSWIGDCRRCKLHAGRKTIVYGQGNPRSQLMFVGEGPGADEDEQGLAFVGRAGQLLTDIIEKGLKIPRTEVFIANVIKCRPPQNRNPEPDEILACQPFLERQIAAIRPRVLIGLGKFSAQWLLKTAEPISRLRGRFGDYQGIPVMPTWHPAYLLRNPAAKRDVWEDMKAVLKLLADEA